MMLMIISRPNAITRMGQSFSQEAHQYTSSKREITPTRIIKMPKIIPHTGSPRLVPKHISSSHCLREARNRVEIKGAPQFLHSLALSGFSTPHLVQYTNKYPFHALMMNLPYNIYNLLKNNPGDCQTFFISYPVHLIIGFKDEV